MENENENIVLQIENLEKSFRSNKVLQNITLELKKGETLAVLGKSGTGKSVLIKCIVRLIEPDEGKIKMLGENINELGSKKLNAVREKTGFVFQGAALYDSMSVRENLEFPMRRIKKISQREINSRVKESLKSVGLSEAIDKMPSELSGGMRKRVGLARALMLQPEIIFYDEPTTGLDTITSAEISNLILDVQKKHNASSIVITHDLHCAKNTANRILILADGVIAAEGNFSELKNSKEERVRKFFE